MPRGLPPERRKPAPHYVTLPPGTVLWRVSSITDRDSPFRPAPDPERDSDTSFADESCPHTDEHCPAADDGPQGESRAGWGGRFDPTLKVPYPFCYAALDDLTALCEVLLRDIHFEAGMRLLPREKVQHRRLQILETVEPLTLISLLEAADLAAAWQDTWLVHAEPPRYRCTRQWAHWLRDAPGPDGSAPDGMIWPSKRQPTGRALLLFGDRCVGKIERSPLGERRFGDDNGLRWLNRRLSLVQTAVAAPEDHGGSGERSWEEEPR